MEIIEKIRKEIERRLSWHITTEARAAYNNVIRFIDSIQSEETLPGIEYSRQVAGLDYLPVDWAETLERYGKWIIVQAEECPKELEKAANMMYPPGINDNLRNAFQEGAWWQKSQMLKDGIDCEVKIDAGGYPYIERTIELYDYEKDEPIAKKGDKYKLVLLKVTEDEAGRI